jgi:hypothetical protein
MVLIAKFKVLFDTDTKKTSFPAKHSRFGTTDRNLEEKSARVDITAFSVKLALHPS